MKKTFYLIKYPKQQKRTNNNINSEENFSFNKLLNIEKQTNNNIYYGDNIVSNKSITKNKTKFIIMKKI